MATTITKYKPREMPPHAVIVAIAKRRSGKSFLIRDFLYCHRKRFFAGIVMSGTEAGNHFYEREVGIPKRFIYDDYDEGALEKMVRRQRDLSLTGKAQPVFVILDDLGFDKKVFNRPVMRQLLLNGRHWKITLYICLQYALDVAPSIRSNIDVIVLLKDNVNRDKLFKTFFSLVPNFRQFSVLMDACTDDYKAMILDNTANSTSISDCIYWYRAKKRKRFRVGHASFYRDTGERRQKKKTRSDVVLLP
jgi:hypothetical protein